MLDDCDVGSEGSTYIVETFGTLLLGEYPTRFEPLTDALASFGARVFEVSRSLCAEASIEAVGTGGGEISGTSNAADAGAATPASGCKVTGIATFDFVLLRARPAPNSEIPAATTTITAADARLLRRSW